MPELSAVVAPLLHVCRCAAHCCMDGQLCSCTRGRSASRHTRQSFCRDANTDSLQRSLSADAETAHCAGYGTEAAIGRLTRLTKLHLSVDRDRASRCTRKRVREGVGTLERGSALQLLDSSRAAGGVCDDAGVSGGGGGGGSGGSRNTGLQNVVIECSGGLTDTDLAAAAAALPDLRQLELITIPGEPADWTASLRGAGLVALGACRRLTHLTLNRCINPEGRELAVQLPGIGSLQTLQLIGSTRMDRVDDNSIRELQAAFQAKRGRQLPVLNSQVLSGNESPVY